MRLLPVVGPLMSERLECPTCGDVVEEPRARFCGRCGSALESPVAADDASDPVHERLPDGSRDLAASLSRRGFIAGAAGLLIGGVAGARWARHHTSEAGGAVDPAVQLPEATFEAGDVQQLIERVRSDGPMMFPRESPRVAVTIWDPAAQAGGQTAREVYGEEGQRHPVAGDTGLMALSLKSTHIGCAVPYCDTSGWFEDPCHGSKWNSWGEWMSGAAPRGLDRFGSSIAPEGTLVVDLRAHQLGPPRETRFGESEPSGPLCVNV